MARLLLIIWWTTVIIILAVGLILVIYTLVETR
jgi:hypothetical protein